MLRWPVVAALAVTRSFTAGRLRLAHAGIAPRLPRASVVEEKDSEDPRHGFPSLCCRSPIWGVPTRGTSRRRDYGRSDDRPLAACTTASSSLAIQHLLTRERRSTRKQSGRGRPWRALRARRQGVRGGRRQGWGQCAAHLDRDRSAYLGGPLRRRWGRCQDWPRSRRAARAFAGLCARSRKRASDPNTEKGAPIRTAVDLRLRGEAICVGSQCQHIPH